MTETPVTMDAKASIGDAARCMRDDDIGDVLVTDGEKLYGVVTDRDLVVRAMAKQQDLEQTAVGSIASRSMVTVAPDDAVDHAVHVMRTHALRRLPVVDGERLVGIVSLGDLAREKDPTSALADISAAEPNA
ncbi:CBS domain-containing protein [Yinghuangia soli]